MMASIREVFDSAEHQYDRGVSRMDVVVNAHNNDPVGRLLQLIVASREYQFA